MTTPLEEHLFRQLTMSFVPCEHGGELAMQLPVGPTVTNSRGGLQGGLIATLADVVAGIALHEHLPKGTGAATSDLTVHFLSAVTVGPAHAEASVRRRGRSTAVTQVEVYDAGRDVLAAICTLTFSVIQLRDGQYDPKGSPR